MPTVLEGLKALRERAIAKFGPDAFVVGQLNDQIAEIEGTNKPATVEFHGGMIAGDRRKK